MKPLDLFVAVLVVGIAVCARGEDKLPDVTLGVTAGYAHHLGKTTYTDAVSGATQRVDDLDVSDPGAAFGVMLDSGLFAVGPLDAGFGLRFLETVPGFYHEVGLIPRLKLRLETSSTDVPGVEPWLGVPINLTFHDDLGPWIMLGMAAGVDLAIADTGFIAGLALELCLANPLAAANQRIDVENGSATVTEITTRLNSIFVRFVLGWRPGA